MALHDGEAIDVCSFDHASGCRHPFLTVQASFLEPVLSSLDEFPRSKRLTDLLLFQ